MENAYTKTNEDVLRHFEVSESDGLSQDQVKRAKKRPVWLLFVARCLNIYLLIYFYLFMYFFAGTY
uniref:Cation-transporting P-type ATPase N-terminal domain-containing protein n=1 Tax=Eptatretus burgeri TaxID=7764 RepID=A0A8C4R4D0_EPTBU